MAGSWEESFEFLRRHDRVGARLPLSIDREERPSA